MLMSEMLPLNSWELLLCSQQFFQKYLIFKQVVTDFWTNMMHVSKRSENIRFPRIKFSPIFQKFVTVNTCLPIRLRNNQRLNRANRQQT